MEEIVWSSRVCKPRLFLFYQECFLHRFQKKNEQTGFNSFSNGAPDLPEVRFPSATLLLVS